MKKLIAFSVIFALLASALFALDLGTFSAQTDIRIDLLDTGAGADGQVTGAGTGGYWSTATADGGTLTSPAWVAPTAAGTTSDLHAGGWEDGLAGVHENRVRFSFSYETTGGEAGISGRIDFGQGAAGNNNLDGLTVGWWKPVDIVKVTLGGTRFNRRLDEHQIWWDYEHDGRNARGRSTSSFIAFEVGPFADMVTVKLGLMGDGAAMTNIGDRYIESLVAQAVFNLGDLGTAAVTFDNGTKVIIADYQATFAGFNVKAAFGFKTNNPTDGTQWGLSAQVDTNIEGIGLLARFNTDEFTRMQIFAEASYGIDLVELDFGTVRFAPKVNAAFNIKNTRENAYPLNGDTNFVLGYEAPITLTKTIDGFTFYTGAVLSGSTDLNNFNNIFRLRVPVRFQYRF